MQQDADQGRQVFVTKYSEIGAEDRMRVDVSGMHHLVGVGPALKHLSSASATEFTDKARDTPNISSMYASRPRNAQTASLTR